MTAATDPLRYYFHEYHHHQTKAQASHTPMTSLKRVRTEMISSSSSYVVAPSPTKRKASPAIYRVKPLQGSVPASKYITMEMLRPHFEKPLAEVAELFGICRTSLKKICRKQGIARWPHRHILELRKSIKSMENAMEHFTGEERLSFAKQLDRQREHLATMLEIPRTNIGSAASTPLKSLASARSSSDSSVQSNKENRYVTIQLQPIALKNAQVLQQNRNTALVLPKEYSNQHQLQQQQQSKQLTNQCANTPLYHGLGTSHKSHSHDQSHAHHWLSSSTYRPNPCEMKQPILRLPPITFLLHGKKA